MLLTLVLMISVGIKLPCNIGYQCKGKDHLILGNNYQDQCTSQHPRAEPKVDYKTLLAVRKLKKFPGWEPAFHIV